MGAMLDAVYRAAGAAAALCLLAICLLVSAQVGLNILARLGGADLAFTIPSYADFAGFLLAAGTFLAGAYTLRAGGHIRVNLVVRRLSERGRLVLELLVLAVAAAIAGYATWFAGALVAESLRYGDMSTGMIAIPIWIPQLPMAVGLALLTLALVHTLIEALLTGAPVIIDSAEAE